MSTIEQDCESFKQAILPVLDEILHKAEWKKRLYGSRDVRVYITVGRILVYWGQ